MSEPVPAGVPWLHEQACRRPAQLALIDDEGALSYGELSAQADAYARGLVSHGVRSGEPVAIRLAPRREFVALLFALQRIGAVAAPLPLRATPAEVRAQLGRLRAKLVVCDGAESGTHGVTTMTPAALTRGVSEAIRLPATVAADAPVTILSTSGSSAEPKMVVLTNANHHASARATMERLDADPRDRWLDPLPLWHAGGLAILFRACVWGFAVRLLARFDEDALLRSLRADEITCVSLVPTMLARLLEREVGAAGARLRVALLGGAALSPALARRALRAGIPVHRSYGLTETASAITIARPCDVAGDPTSSGTPLAGVDLAIASACHEAVGEIRIRAPQVMRGYLGDREQSARALRGGWLHTADLGRLRASGSLYVAGRADDVIISGGENISPAEVEAVLSEHPAIVEAAVFGVADERWGSAVAAAVVLRAGARETPESLHAWCRARIAAFKVPRRWRFVEALPRTPTGKIRRSALAMTSLLR